jgi:hypothetical protein
MVRIKDIIVFPSFPKIAPKWRQNFVVEHGGSLRGKVFRTILTGTCCAGANYYYLFVSSALSASESYEDSKYNDRSVAISW